MECPNCGAKIGQKNYDAAFEWYECPQCEGCFTGDEIMEAELASNSRSVRAGAVNSVVELPDDMGNSSDRRTSSGKVVAKAKKKKKEIDADAEAIAEYEKSITETVVVKERSTKHRDEIPTGQVVQIMADEIELVYEELGEHISRVNAEDKALTIWRNMTIHDGITARETTFSLPLCRSHA